MALADLEQLVMVASSQCEIPLLDDKNDSSLSLLRVIHCGTKTHTMHVLYKCDKVIEASVVYVERKRTE